MQQYIELLKTIKEKGTWKNPARENMPRTLSLFGHQYRCNLQDGFPILTTKKVSMKNIATELIWFLRGGSPLNIKYLVDNGCKIWNQDAYRYYIEKTKQGTKESIVDFEKFIYLIKNEESSIMGGYDYGDCPLGYELWRNFNGVDQIKNIIEGLKKNPEGRRHILTAYDPSISDFALAPCHIMAQFNCREVPSWIRAEMAGLDISKHIGNLDENELYKSQPSYYLDCQLYQRSCDVFLGVPYNTASYALLTHIIAEICGFAVGEFVHTFGDVHIYENHMKAVDEQLTRIPTESPRLVLNPDLKIWCSDLNIENYISLDEFIDGIEIGEFTLENYNPQPSIKADLSTGL